MLQDLRTFLRSFNFGSTAFVVTSVCLAIICYTRIYTTIAYRRAIVLLEDSSKAGIVPSPVLPYTIPWLGHTTRFLERHADRWYHRQGLHPPHGVFSMIIAGRRTHIVTNPAATRHLFRHAYTSGLTRQTFVKDLLIKCLLVSPNDTSIINTGKGRQLQEDVFHRYLSRHGIVTELTSTFSSVLFGSFQDIFDNNDTVENISLFSWLRRRILSASLTTFFGEELVKMYPEICDDISAFDSDLCSFFFDFPRILNRTAWNRRQRILKNLMRWDMAIHKTNHGPPEDPSNSPAWDPLFGSRFNKARMLLYDSLGLSLESRAGMNLSIMFALASNVVPAIGWMLFHLLGGPDSQTLLKSAREEVDRAIKPDGTLDVRRLLSASSLLQSMWTEVLRHYCDNMIMREVVHDTTIPLDDQELRWVRAEKGDTVISPCWVAHREDAYWQTPDTFMADRFIGEHLATSKTNALAGVPTARMYPFGGGKSMCAGRVFAKEEAIVAVAQTLSSFDFVVHGFLDANGKKTSDFPKLAPSLPGVVVYVPEGDLLVTIRKRESKV